MKNIFFILSLISTLQCLAQDPQLFENPWYLQKVIISNVDFPAPSNNEIDVVPLNIYETFMTTEVCASISGVFNTIDNSSFFIDQFTLLLNLCALQENTDFGIIYFNDFYNWQTPNRAFSYSIVLEGNDTKTLTITNDVGDQAIYGSEVLSVDSFDSINVSVYPNPVNENLLISCSCNNIEVIKIIDISGKVVLKYDELSGANTRKIDLTHLKSGIYFLRILTDQGITTKKVIKK